MLKIVRMMGNLFFVVRRFHYVKNDNAWPISQNRIFYSQTVQTRAIRVLHSGKEDVVVIKQSSQFFVFLGRHTLVFLLPIVLVLLLLPVTTFAQDSISEVAVIFGSSSSIKAPAGFTKVDVDLNSGAGGDYIYVCYKKGVGAPITGLAITFGGHVPSPEYTWTKIDVDLNRHAGGEFIFLWYTKDPACSTIGNIIILLDSQATPDGYTKIPWDLNRGAGGAFIYLAYNRI